MQHVGWDHLEESAASQLAAGATHDAVTTKLITEEGVTFYEANFILAGAIRRNARSASRIDEINPSRVAVYRDAHMLIPLISLIAIVAFLFS